MTDGAPTQPAEPQGEPHDPFAIALAAVLGRRRLSQLHLVDATGLTRSAVNRLMNLERDAATINLESVRKVFKELADELEKRDEEEVWEYVRAHPELSHVWEEYLAQRGSNVFYELAAALVNQTTRTDVNPVSWVVTLAEEGIWQFISQPRERWLITDVLAELEFSKLIRRTSQVIDHPNFRRLAILMPGHSADSFEDFKNAASAKHFDEKVRCIEIPDREFFMRMRIDDPCSLTGAASGVMGTAAVPLLFRLPQEVLGTIRGRWAKVINYFDEHPNAETYEKCRRRFPSNATKGAR